MPPGAEGKPLSVAVVGLGVAGRHHLERLGLRSDFRIVGAYDDCVSAARKAAGLANRLYDSWHDVLGDSEVEVIFLATPPATHAPLAMQSLLAQKHVVVETPLCLRPEEAESLQKAATRLGRSLVVAQTRRSDEDFASALRCLQQGELGRLIALKYVDWQYNPRLPGRGRSGETQAGQSLPQRDLAPPLSATHWREHASTGGGVLWEAGAHLFDQLLQLTVEPPRTVEATLFRPRPTAEVDDGFLALFRYASGAIAQIEISRGFAVPLTVGWTIVGDRASYANGYLYSTTSEGEVVDVPSAPPAQDPDQFYQALATHLRLGGINPATCEQAQAVVALITATRRAARSRQPAAINPGAIVGD